MQAMGANGRVVLDFENVPGTLNESPQSVRLAFIKSNVKAEQNQNNSNVITGRRDPSEPYRGFIDVNGDIELPLDTRQIGYILKAAFGAPKTTKENNKYRHVFRLGASMPSFSLEQGFQDIQTYAQYLGCKVSKISFSFGGDNELTVPVTVMGIREVIADESFDEDAALVPLDKLNFDNAYLKEGGADVAIATEVKLDLDFGLDGDTYCLGGKGFRASVDDGITQITGSVKAFFGNRVLLDKTIAGTKSSLEIPLIKGEHSMTITLPELIYKRSTPGIDGPKGIYLEMQYNAFYANNGKNTSIEIVLINDIESYDKAASTFSMVGMAVVGKAVI